MKINRRVLNLLAATTFFLSVGPGHAQTTTNLVVAAPTNTVLTLKELMSSNNIVTNTVGLVLVKLSPALWAGKFEVTQEAFQKVMNGNPSAFAGKNNPVDSVSWNDAMTFCGKLTAAEAKAMELPDNFFYALPTQSQWETLAADATVQNSVMKLNGDRSGTSPVGSLGANSLGLYDVRGNVMEWCLDPQDQAYRVLRGGAWDTFIEINARLEFRNYAAPDEKKNDYGFRVLLQAAFPVKSN
jgi:formylglycine-generating enzyme required for sulfatase activity